MQSRAGNEEPEETWENLAELDIGEGGEELKDKNGKRGGKKEGAGLLEASRRLFKELKKSPLSKTLQVNTFMHCKMYHVKGACKNDHIISTLCSL